MTRRSRRSDRTVPQLSRRRLERGGFHGGNLFLGALEEQVLFPNLRDLWPLFIQTHPKHSAATKSAVFLVGPRRSKPTKLNRWMSRFSTSRSVVFLKVEHSHGSVESWPVGPPRDSPPHLGGSRTALSTLTLSWVLYLVFNRGSPKSGVPRVNGNVLDL